MGGQRKRPMHARHSKPPQPAAKHGPSKWLKRAAVAALLAAVANGLVSYVPRPEHPGSVPLQGPGATPRPTTSPRSTHTPHRAGGPQGHGYQAPQPVTDPLETRSEDPIDPAVQWAFFTRPAFAGLHAQITFETDGDQVAALNEEFFRLHGYAPVAHTQLVVANDGPASIEIPDIEVQSSCRGPAKSTFVDITGLTDGPSSANASDIRLGYVLNQRSQDTQASTAQAANPSTWTPGYFDSHSVTIGPYGVQAFDIWVIPSDAACSFWYQVTVLDGGAKFLKTIGDDSQPFRVSALSAPGAQADPAAAVPSGYSNVYVGGTSSPLPNGALYREPARQTSVAALYRAA
jgi:hypothetical protein